MGDRVKEEAQAHDSQPNFFWQNVPDPNRKHRGDHYVAIMSLHVEHFLLIWRNETLGIGRIARWNFNTMEEITKLFLLFLG